MVFYWCKEKDETGDGSLVLSPTLPILPFRVPQLRSNTSGILQSCISLPIPHNNDICICTSGIYSVKDFWAPVFFCQNYWSLYCTKTDNLFIIEWVKHTPFSMFCQKCHDFNFTRKKHVHRDSNTGVKHLTNSMSALDHKSWWKILTTILAELSIYPDPILLLIWTKGKRKYFIWGLWIPYFTLTLHESILVASELQRSK